MKSISSQLNRGTELLKQTVQRAIFSTKITVLAAPTAKPTAYHSDPHAVLRSSSVDSLHLETCHIRPIRPYSVTTYRRTKTGMCCPVVLRSTDALVFKISPLKAKPRFKLQKGQGSAFCSLRETSVPKATSSTPPSPPKKSPVKVATGRGGKRKRSVESEDVVLETTVEDVQKSSVTLKRGKKNTTTNCPSDRQQKEDQEEDEDDSKNKSKNRRKTSITAKQENKRPTKLGKRKSLEQEKQEKEDFEMAKKLQKEFDTHSIGGETNSSIGTMSTRRTRNGRSLTNSVATNYSLRTTRSLSKISSCHASPLPFDGEEGIVVGSATMIKKSNNNNNKKSPPGGGRNGLKNRNTNHDTSRMTRSRKSGGGTVNGKSTK